METIRFYKLGEPYGCFSNFSRHSFELGETTWPTSEHYFQAKKFPHSWHEEAIRLAPTPSRAAAMGRDRSKPLRTDWEQVKEVVMFDACLAKFTQNPEIREVLLGTGDALLVEHTKKDAYWGDGGDGSGKNRLGHVLMAVRDALARLPGSES